MPKGKHDNHPRSQDHYRWNDKIVSSHGYTKIRVGVDHPLADPNGYAYEHLLVWVSAGKARPLADEVLHHANGNKQDNRISNLHLRRRTEHSVYHAGGLSDEDVLAIRYLYANSEMDMPGLASRFDVSVQRVSRIIRGETRLSVGGPISKKNRVKIAAGRLLDGVEWNQSPER